MSTTYSTPGVYVQEVSVLPPSVAQVATAVPAFIGFTAKGAANQPSRISSMLEFRNTFGDGLPPIFKVEVKANSNTNTLTIDKVSRESGNNYHLYYAMRHFFDNGGGSCYVVSVGSFKDRENKDEQVFKEALDAIKKIDEPTLLAFPDALFLPSAKYYTVVNHALAQCAELQDRFTIIDVHPGDTRTASTEEAELKTGTNFRNAGLNAKNLMYGAAYTPYLNTVYSYSATDADVIINEVIDVDKGSAVLKIGVGASIEVSYSGDKPSPASKAPSAETVLSDVDNFAGPTVVINNNNKLTVTVKKAVNTIDDIRKAWLDIGLSDRKNFDLRFIGATDAKATEAVSEKKLEFPAKMTGVSLSDPSIKGNNSALYNQIKARIGQELVTLPPSAAIAGIYAQVDRSRGVWKSPANVAVAAVIGPSVLINHEEQGLLNIDPTAGKSINAIRNFTGRGTIVWGGRTLAGNDNEWRYVNVRRLFITIEESVRKASAFAVFEPNDANTWLKVKAMIDNYLYGLWQQGALAGSKPESSYFVNVGLGRTMTNQDILEGNLIVEIGIAAVRPAEFVILRFSHKLQEA
jgi:uncharacterized protein